MVPHISIGKKDVDQKAIAAVLSYYSVGLLKKATRAPHGRVNDNWFVDTDKGRYFLRRRSTSFTRISIDFELELIERLLEAGFPTARIIRTTDDALQLEIDGRNWELYDYVIGRPFQAGSLARTRSAARLLARFHHVVVDYHSTVNAPDRRLEISEVVGMPDQYRSRLKASTGPLGVLMAVPLLRFFRRQATLIWNGTQPLATFPPRLVHGDFHPYNVLFRGDEAVALLDFGGAMFFYRAYDVARAILDFASLNPNCSDTYVAPDWARIRAFACAYQAALPLSNTEIQAMETMVRLGYLIGFSYSLGEFIRRQQIAPLLHAWSLYRWLERHAALISKISDLMTKDTVATGRKGSERTLTSA